MSKFAVEYTIPGGSETVVIEADSAKIAGLLCPTGQPIRVNKVADDEEVTDPGAGETGDESTDDQEQSTQESSTGQEAGEQGEGDEAGSPEAVT